MRFRAIALASLVAAMGSAIAADSDEPVFSGEYFYNFENSFLTPDGKNEDWCIDSPLMKKAMLPAKNANGQWGTSHVVVRGRLGPEGKFGGLGRCKRVLAVSALLAVTNMRGRN